MSPLRPRAPYRGRPLPTCYATGLEYDVFNKCVIKRVFCLKSLILVLFIFLTSKAARPPPVNYKLAAMFESGCDQGFVIITKFRVVVTA